MKSKFRISCFVFASLLLEVVNSNTPTTVKEVLEGNSSDNSKRRERLFPVFQIVTFPNAPCRGASRNGTCFTQEECSAMGGNADNSCANGFGVCCIFQRTCGTMSNQNCTYFTTPSTIPTSGCTLTIFPCSDNICQLRLDFNTFMITGPSTDTTTVGDFLFGVPEPTAAIPETPFTNVGRCLTDTFSVTNPGGPAPSTICGTVTGEHMYVDSSSCCNNLVFQFGETGVGATISTRAFDVKVTQYSCDFNNLTPPGCTQWFFGETTGTVMTYNFENQQLADQVQNICVRREQGRCRICWSTAEGTDFSTSGGQVPVFQIVTFPNDPCQGASRNGTCFTQEECTTLGGNPDTSCASGYGVCCIFQRSCGAMSNQNCTYFTTPSTIPTASSCTLTICPCGSNICQLRLDFNTFTISGPSTDTTVVGDASFGFPAPSNTAGSPFTNIGRCLTDTFSVTNPGGNAPPTICGTATSEHMYVDSSASCNDLVFNFGDTGVGTTLSTRTFDIKVTQYSCGFNNLAPPGCTQWFFGATTGTVMTYNFNNRHLADQRQNICVRREQGLCRICWTSTAADFSTSGKTMDAAPSSQGIIGPAFYCAYGNGGDNLRGFDCAIIPGAENPAGNAAPSRICGRNAGLVTVSGTISVTVCSIDTTFMISFISDNVELESESNTVDVGFRVNYIMDATMCT